MNHDAESYFPGPPARVTHAPARPKYQTMRVLEARQAAAKREEAEARRREAEGGAVGEVVDALEDAKLQLRGQLGQPVRGRGVVVGACTRSSDGGSIAWAC